MGHCPLYQMSYRLIVFGDKTSDGSTYGGQAVKLRYHRGTQKVVFRSYFFERTESPLSSLYFDNDDVGS